MSNFSQNKNLGIVFSKSPCYIENAKSKKIGVNEMKLKEKWANRLGALLLYLVIILGVIILNARFEYLNTVMK